MWPFARRAEPDLVVDRMISLGALCEVAYQVRRLARSERAYPFDWWDTPLSGVLKVLQSGASEIFAAHHIVKLPDVSGRRPAFYSRLTGTAHQHEFHGGENFLEFDETEIGRRLTPKYEALLARLVSDCASGTTLFVRQRRPDYDLEGVALEAALDELHAALAGFSADPRLLLLDYPPVAPRPWLIEARVSRYRDWNDLGSRRGWNEVFRRHRIVCRSSGERFGFEDFKESFAAPASLGERFRRGVRRHKELRDRRRLTVMR